MTEYNKQKNKAKRQSSSPFFLWDRCTAFGGQMALAYLNHSLTLALGGGFLIASTILITSPLRSGLAPDFMGLFNLVLQTISSTAVIILSILMLGLLLNAITVGIFMGFHHAEVSDYEALVLIPRYIFVYNLVMMPLLLVLYLIAVSLPTMLTFLLTVNAVMVSFIAGDVARQAWDDVAEWYRANRDETANTVAATTKAKNSLAAAPSLDDVVSPTKETRQQPVKRSRR